MTKIKFAFTLNDGLNRLTATKIKKKIGCKMVIELSEDNFHRENSKLKTLSVSHNALYDFWLNMDGYQLFVFSDDALSSMFGVCYAEYTPHFFMFNEQDIRNFIADKAVHDMARNIDKHFELLRDSFCNPLIKVMDGIIHDIPYKNQFSLTEESYYRALPDRLVTLGEEVKNNRKALQLKLRESITAGWE